MSFPMSSLIKLCGLRVPTYLAMSHQISVFVNSCLSVPVDPVSKMPKTAYERKNKTTLPQGSIETMSTHRSVTPPDIEAIKLKEFYNSIPDYSDLNHLPPEEFNATLKRLRDKKRAMFHSAIENIDAVDNGIENSAVNSVSVRPDIFKKSKSKMTSHRRRRYSINGTKEALTKSDYADESTLNFQLPSQRKLSYADLNRQLENHLKISSMKSLDEKVLEPKPKRNHLSCSITWHDSKLASKDEIDEKFAEFFGGAVYGDSKEFDDEFRTRSMPSSPLRNRRMTSPIKRRKSITIPKPFKMTERDQDTRILRDLSKFRKSFSADMLHVKRERKVFRAKPVPIESRIPLYDKIMEDQAMRRALSKINSEAELRAKIKPFNFTKREDKTDICNHAIPKSNRHKFRARPVPKNLFSNFIYEKKKEEDFFRSMNRRIRAEELLRNSKLPANMALRERSYVSTPAAHSDLPTDPSPVVPSESSFDKQRARSPTKNQRRRNEFITTSPQPFRLNTAERAVKRMEEITKKIYQESKSTTSVCANSDGKPRAYSALDLQANATGRSNLAAILRAETIKKKFEMETARRHAEQRRRIETRTRDRILRSKPAWHMVKNNCEEDIAMRLQTRRDEDRLRREEFLHEMELMYGRVHQQPMLFERYYAPRHYITADSIQLSPRKKNRTKKLNSQNVSRKVSIDAAAYNGNVLEYLNRLEKESKLYTDSDITADGTK